MPYALITALIFALNARTNRSVWTIKGECGGNLPRPLTASMHSG
jgi:hypothetical protein